MSEIADNKIELNGKVFPIARFPLGKLFSEDNFRLLLNEINSLNASNITVEKLIQLFSQCSLFSVLSLATIYIQPDSHNALADFLGLKPEQLKLICKYAYDSLSEDIKAEINNYVEESKKIAFLALPKIIQKPNTEVKEDNEIEGPSPLAYVPLPDNSVDNKDYFVLAKDQGELGTCYVFGATALREHHDNKRSGRGQKMDFSEAYGLWLNKAGGAYAHDTGGFHGDVLGNYSTYGNALQDYWFYNTKLINQNYVGIPAPKDSIIISQYHKGDFASFINNNVNAVISALNDGKTVCISTIAGYWWNTFTGEISDQFDPSKGGGHCVLITGFVKDPTYPGGGYFIVRNSWGQKWGTGNIMGPEYGGYLTMSYDYYSKYCSDPMTFSSNLYTIKNWLMEYYPNTTLDGIPSNTYYAKSIDFDWTGFNNFSMRCSNSIYFPSGWYRFKLAADDGVKLWVDDRILVDLWYDHATITKEVDYYVTEGVHTIRIEFYQRGGGAILKFDYTPLDWTFYYYYLLPSEINAGETAKNGPMASLDLPPQYFHIENDLNKVWSHIPPVPADENGFFTLTTNRKIKFSETSNVIFYARVSGGIDLYLDGVSVISHLGDNDQEYFSEPVPVTAGEHNISLIFNNKNLYTGKDFKAFLYVNWYSNEWVNEIHHSTSSSAGQGINDTKIISFKSEGDNLDLEQALKLVDDVKASSIYDELSYFGRKKIFSPGKVHRFKIETKSPFRLMVDGLDVLDHPTYGSGGNPYYEVDVELTKGVHEIAVEVIFYTSSITLKFTDESYSMWTEQWYNSGNLEGLIFEDNTDKVDYNWQRRFTDLDQYVLAPIISSRQRTSLMLERGMYRFNLTTNRNLRLFVNGRIYHDTWLSKPDAKERCESVDVEIKGGNTEIIIESFGSKNNYILALSYYYVGYLVDYYKDTNLGRNSNGDWIIPPSLSCYEKEVNFNYGLAGPAPVIGVDNFSSRRLGSIYLPVGFYEITLSVGPNDGMRLYIDGRLFIDRWNSSNGYPTTARIHLTGRYHEIVYEYKHQTGNSSGKIQFKRIF